MAEGTDSPEERPVVRPGWEGTVRPLEKPVPSTEVAVAERVVENVEQIREDVSQIRTDVTEISDKFTAGWESLQQTFSPEYQQALTADRSRAGELAALQEAIQATAGGGIPETMVRAVSPEDRDRYGEEWQTITVQMGPYQRRINIPSVTDKQLQWIRDRIAILENSPESWGGGINAIVAQEAYAVAQSPDLHSEVRQQMSGMDGEFISRQIVHEYYSIYRRSASKDTLVQASEPFGNNPNYMNVVMHIPEVGKAFGLLEQHAQEWLRARGSGYEEVRLNLAAELASEAGGRPEDFVWAVRLAERIWRFTGRAIIHESLEENPFSPGNMRFIGEGAGGDFVLRRVLQERMWMVTDGRAQKEFVDRDDVLNNKGKNSFTFRVGDYWSDNMNAIFRNSWERKSVPFAETKQRLFGSVKDEDVEWNTGDPGKIGEVKVDKIKNMANFNWAEADLTLLGSSFGIYMGFFVSSAENARAKVMGVGEGLFRTPAYEGLKEINNSFDYDGAPTEQGMNIKADLLKRTLKFMGDRNYEVRNMPNINRLAKSRYTTLAVAERVIDQERGESLKDEILGFPEFTLPKWVPNSKNEKGEQKKISLFLNTSLTRFIVRTPQYLFLNLAPGGAVWEWFKKFFGAVFSLK